MEKVRFGKTELLVSKIALGGIPLERLSVPDAAKLVQDVLKLGVNFIDTANSYSDSEAKIGLAIKGVPRESLVIASKSMAKDKKTFAEHIDLSLERLGVDYIDLYQHHHLSSQQAYDAVFGENGAHEALEEAVKAGKVRFAAFSSHSIPFSLRIMREGKFAAVQLPFNFVDDMAAKEAIPLAKELDMGFLSMKPMGGGLLSDAGISFRYLAQFDRIVPNPGIEKLSEMEEIVKIASLGETLSEADKATIEKIKAELGDRWCHRCDYCAPCPEKIHISMLLNIHSIMKRMPFNRTVSIGAPIVEYARNCTECGACVVKCPYDLDIPKLVKEQLILWDEYMKSHENS